MLFSPFYGFNEDGTETQLTGKPFTEEVTSGALYADFTGNSLGEFLGAKDATAVTADANKANEDSYKSTIDTVADWIKEAIGINTTPTNQTVEEISSKSILNQSKSESSGSNYSDGKKAVIKDSANSSSTNSIQVPPTVQTTNNIGTVGAVTFDPKTMKNLREQAFNLWYR